jgi:hypothetical protein
MAFSASAPIDRAPAQRARGLARPFGQEPSARRRRADLLRGGGSGLPCGCRDDRTPSSRASAARPGAPSLTLPRPSSSPLAQPPTFGKVGITGLLAPRGLVGAASFGSALARRSSMPVASWLRPLGGSPALASRLPCVPRQPRIGMCTATGGGEPDQRDRVGVDGDVGARLLEQLKQERVSAETLALAELTVKVHTDALAASDQTIAAKDRSLAAHVETIAALHQTVAAQNNAAVVATSHQLQRQRTSAEQPDVCTQVVSGALMGVIIVCFSINTGLIIFCFTKGVYSVIFGA